MSDASNPSGRQSVVLAAVDDVPEGARKEVVVEGKKIAIFNLEGQCHAVSAECPHRGGPLIRGHLDGYTLRCPIHGWAFDIRTGDSNGRPRNLTVFPVRCDGGRLFIDV